jgi:hypothetical protein
MDKINWQNLSANPKAIHLLEQNPNRIDWDELLINTGAFDLIKRIFDPKLRYFLDMLNDYDDSDDEWYDNSDDEYNQSLESIIDSNPVAYYFFKYNLTVFWSTMSMNEAIFVVDYDYLKASMAKLHEELIEYVYYPTRVSKWMHKYGTDREYLE